jgi:hypothetical protein
MAARLAEKARDVFDLSSVNNPCCRRRCAAPPV